MVWKCCIQYTSKFGKLRSGLQSGNRTGKGQFSFQFQKRAMPENAPTTIQLCSFRLLVRLCSKSFKLGFSSTWTKNFQMFKLNLEKAEKPRIKLPTFVGSKRKQENSRKNLYFCFTDYMKAFVWLTTNWKILKEMEILDHLTWESCVWVRKQQLQLGMKQQTGSKLGE